MSASALPRQTGLKRLAGALAFVCLVLLLLAVENRHAVEAWRAVREDAVPAAARVVDWAGKLPSGQTDGLSGLQEAVARKDSSEAASPADFVLAGEFGPDDNATRAVVGGVAIVGATVRFDNGETLRTQPLRIAAGREAFTLGQTFAQRLNAPADAQIELRRIVRVERNQPIAASALCGARAPGAMALLHRRDRVDLMLFHDRTIIGPDASPAALCGAWRFRKR